MSLGRGQRWGETSAQNQTGSATGRGQVVWCGPPRPFLFWNEMKVEGCTVWGHFLLQQGLWLVHSQVLRFQLHFSSGRGTSYSSPSCPPLCPNPGQTMVGPREGLYLILKTCLRRSGCGYEMLTREIRAQSEATRWP